MQNRVKTNQAAQAPKLKDMPKVFEFHFNPGQNPQSVFGTFCYFPKTRREKKAGLLYLIGEISGSFPQSPEFLAQIAKEIKDGFYQFPSSSQEDVFQTGIDFANQFIAEELKSANYLVNFGALCLQNPFIVKLSKTGGLKMLLLRGGQAYDMAFELSGVSPGKPFPNFIEGNLQKKDKILLLTQSVFNVFAKEKILEQIAPLKNGKEAKRYFKENKKLFREFSGACVLAFVKKAPWPLFSPKKKKYTSPPLLQQATRFGPAYVLLPPGHLEKAVLSLLALVVLLLLARLFL